MYHTLTGGPADLTYPDAFLGRWDVTSVLTKVRGSTEMGSLCACVFISLFSEIKGI